MEMKKVLINDYNIATYSIGESDRVLLLLHGGPGMPCNYMIDGHQHFTKFGFRIVSYDQLGCGESDKPDIDSLWTVDRFVEEVEAVRKALNLGEIYLIGNSWGGILGMEYCYKYQENVIGFVSGNIGFDVPVMQRGFERKKLALGSEAYTMMALREAEGTTDHPEYQAAITLLSYRHICRCEIWPDALLYSAKYSALNVAKKLFGTFFNASGDLKDYNSMSRLKNVFIPVLVLSSEYDFVVPELASSAANMLPNATLKIMRNCSHVPFYENQEQYTQIVLEFINGI